MCVFTDKNIKKYAALALVPFVVVNTYVGCAIATKGNLKEDKYNEDVPGIETTLEIEVEDGIHMTDDMKLSESIVFPQYQFSKLMALYEQAEMSYEQIILEEDRDSDIYASALYAKLKSNSLDDSIIISELENVICFGTQGTCVSEDVWYSSFGNLLGTISEFDNVVDYYYPLAKYLHLNSCSLEHETLFFDEFRVTCSNLETALNLKLPQFDYKSFIIEMIEATDDEKLILQLNTIINSEVNFDDALNELENVYQCAQLPTDLSDEFWNMLFGNLMKTVSPEENVCIFYYDLAYYVHSLWCELHHDVNDFGMYECVDRSLVLEK